MVAEFASPRSSSAIADSLKPTEIDKPRNAASTGHSKREQAAARLEALLEKHALPKGSEQDLWTAFQGLIDSLDDGDSASPEKSEAVELGENVLAEVLAFPQAADLTLVPQALPDSKAASSEGLAMTTSDRAFSMENLLPFRPRPAEPDFDSTPTWNEVVVAFGLEIQRLREAQGLSLDQLRFKTQIPVYQLQALEAGAVEQLPEEIFVRGFFKRICGQLGEEGQLLLAQIPDPKQKQQEILAQWQQPDASISSQVVHLRSAHLYVGYATLLAGAAGGLTWSFQETAQVNPSPNSPQTTVQKPGTQASLNPVQRAARLAFGSDVAQPEQSAPELTP